MEQTILFVNDSVAARDRETTRLKPYSLYHSDTHRRLPLTLIAAVGENMEIGKKGRLVWHIPEDLRHFKDLTMGGAIIMGRNTWESLPKRPLPGRQNIVVTGQSGYEAPGADRASSLEEAIEMAKGSRAFIIGGESVYRSALPLATRLELTRIMATDSEADTWFPSLEESQWEIENESEVKESPEGIRYKFVTYRRAT